MHVTSLLDFCDTCYPNASDDPDADPVESCAHNERPRVFFKTLEKIFPGQEVPRDSVCHLILTASHQKPLELSGPPQQYNIFRVFLTMPWKKILVTVPLAPPRTPAFSKRLIDRQSSFYQSLLPASLSSTRKAVQVFSEAHGVSVSLGTYVQKQLPTYRQWLPRYAPVHYFSTVHFENYSAVPVNPKVSTLARLLEYRCDPAKYNGPQKQGIDYRSLEHRALAEARDSLSDQELSRRIEDLENLLRILKQPLLDSGEDDAVIFMEDVAKLKQLYEDELVARALHGTSFVFASYLFAQSSSYETTRGARFEPLSFADQFAVAYYRLLEQGILMSCAAPTKPMGSLLHSDVMEARKNPTNPTKYLCGMLTPDFIWKTIPISSNSLIFDDYQLNFLTTFGSKA